VVRWRAAGVVVGLASCAHSRQEAFVSATPSSQRDARRLSDDTSFKHLEVYFRGALGVLERFVETRKGK
jgi:hypothetical protein